MKKETNKIIALLPIKQNSERVKGKNFKTFAGKPLFRWVLDTLKSINIIDNLIINTDARQTLVENGLEECERVIIVDRPSHLRGDDISMNLIIENDLNTFESNLCLMTHTTNPLLSSNTIMGAIDKFLENKRSNDSLFTANKIQTRFYDINAEPINHDPNNLIKTQDLPIWYEENSCLYLFTPNSFKKNMARVGSHPIMYPISKVESFDIDDYQDWFIAESVMESIIKNR